MESNYKTICENLKNFILEHNNPSANYNFTILTVNDDYITIEPHEDLKIVIDDEYMSFYHGEVFINKLPSHEVNSVFLYGLPYEDEMM